MSNLNSPPVNGPTPKPPQPEHPTPNPPQPEHVIPDYYKKDEDHSNISSAEFPEDFLFGSGTSAYQVEGGYVKGGKTLSVWDVFSLSCPGGIADGSNGNLACNSFRKYKEDLRVMDQMGFNSYRFSISWPRILPGGRSCFGINRKGIAYYNDVINTCIANGLEPFVTLFHWDTPDYLELEYGGFLDRRIIKDFREFAEICFWEFGDRVKYWTTLNEPWTYTYMGYIHGVYPPCRLDIDIPHDKKSEKGKSEEPPPTHRCTHDAHEEKQPTIERYSHMIRTSRATNSQAPYIVARNLLLAHSEAVHSYRTKFKERQNGIIGIALNSSWLVAKDPENPKDVEAAKRGVDFKLGWFLDPVLYGKYPDSMEQRVPHDNLAGFSAQEKEKLKKSIDFLGLNYYTTYYAEDAYPVLNENHYIYQNVKITHSKKCNPNGKSEVDIPIGEESGSSWLFSVPWGICEHLRYLKGKEGMPPIYITENGWSDASKYNMTPQQACSDTKRKKYYHDHLFFLHKAIKEFEVDVKGYFAWSWCDNFEWSQGYKERFGLMYVDFLNEYMRYPKNSAVWFTMFLAKAVERKKIPKLNFCRKTKKNRLIEKTSAKTSTKENMKTSTQENMMTPTTTIKENMKTSTQENMMTPTTTINVSTEEITDPDAKAS